MSTERERDRLIKLYTDLGTQYVAEMEAIAAKRSELIGIEAKLTQYGWPGITLGAYLGSYLTPQGRQFREEINRLLQRRQYLIQEIERERQRMVDIAMRRQAIAAELAQISMLESQRILEQAERRRKLEAAVPQIAELLEEYQKTRDPILKEMYRRRLRELGYRI